MEKIRCGKSVFTRKDNTQEWKENLYDSINQAKKFNGLDSHVIESRKMLPAKRVVQEDQPEVQQ